MFGDQISAECSHRDSQDERPFHESPIALLGGADHRVDHRGSGKDDRHDDRHISRRRHLPKSQKNSQCPDGSESPCDQRPFPAKAWVGPKGDISTFELQNDQGGDHCGEKISQADPEESHDPTIFLVTHVDGTRMHADPIGSPTDHG